MLCLCKLEHWKQRLADWPGSPSHKGKLVQAASFWTFLCKRSCSMPAASLRELDTASQSWLVLPKTQGVTGYRCVCLSRAAQLPSWGLGVSLVSLSQTCCFYRRCNCATSAFCASEAVHRKVCWLTCCARKNRRLNTDLRFALASKLVPVAGPTVTYGPYCVRITAIQSCSIPQYTELRTQMQNIRISN